MKATFQSKFAETGLQKIFLLFFLVGGGCNIVDFSVLLTKRWPCSICDRALSWVSLKICTVNEIKCFGDRHL